MIKNTVKEATIIVLVSIALSLAVYSLRPGKIGLTRPGPTTGQETDNKDYKVITIDQAISMFNKADVLFADARSFSDYEDGHIKGALHLDLSDQDSWMDDFIARTPPESSIITYCDGPSCHLAESLAELLFFNGFDNVYCVKNGWTLWNENQMPVASVK